jgi:hypothetical protein
MTTNGSRSAAPAALKLYRTMKSDDKGVLFAATVRGAWGRGLEIYSLTGRDGWDRDAVA